MESEAIFLQPTDKNAPHANPTQTPHRRPTASMWTVLISFSSLSVVFYTRSGKVVYFSALVREEWINQNKIFTYIHSEALDSRDIKRLCCQSLRSQHSTLNHFRDRKVDDSYSIEIVWVAILNSPSHCTSSNGWWIGSINTAWKINPKFILLLPLFLLPSTHLITIQYPVQTNRRRIPYCNFYAASTWPQSSFKIFPLYVLTSVRNDSRHQVTPWSDVSSVANEPTGSIKKKRCLYKYPFWLEILCSTCIRTRSDDSTIPCHLCNIFSPCW